MKTEKTGLCEASWYKDFVNIVKGNPNRKKKMLSLIPIEALLFIDQRDLFKKAAEYYQRNINFSQAMLAEDILLLIAGKGKLDDNLLKEFAPLLSKYEGSCFQNLAKSLRGRQAESKEEKKFFETHFPKL